MRDSLEEFAAILQVHLLWSEILWCQISKYRLNSMELSG